MFVMVVPIEKQSYKIKVQNIVQISIVNSYRIGRIALNIKPIPINKIFRYWHAHTLPNLTYRYKK